MSKIAKIAPATGVLSASDGVCTKLYLLHWVLHSQSDDKPLWEARDGSRGFPFLSGAQAHRGALVLPHGMVSWVWVFPALPWLHLGPKGPQQHVGKWSFCHGEAVF